MSERKSVSRNTMVTSDVRPEVKIWPLRACAMHPVMNSSFIAAEAMGQIPRSTLHISSFLLCDFSHNVPSLPYCCPYFFVCEFMVLSRTQNSYKTFKLKRFSLPLSSFFCPCIGSNVAHIGLWHKHPTLLDSFSLWFICSANFLKTRLIYLHTLVLELVIRIFVCYIWILCK